MTVFELRSFLSKFPGNMQVTVLDSDGITQEISSIIFYPLEDESLIAIEGEK